MQKKNYNGLFIGLSTIDLIYLVGDVPGRNSKIVATKQLISSGGPANNASIAFAYLNGASTLITSFGNHPITNIILSEANTYHVKLINLTDAKLTPPTISSILVTQSTGERAVISVGSSHIEPQNIAIQENYSDKMDIILVDGYHMNLCKTVARVAKNKQIPVVLDGGSWKPGTGELLQFVDYAICSNNFLPPKCKTKHDVFEFLRRKGIKYSAITHGENPVCFNSINEYGEIPIEKVKVKDTLGAGDIFHGAFCFYLLENGFDFFNTLKKASEIATTSCLYYGTRQWMGKSSQ